MACAEPSLACSVLEYELESLNGGIDSFGPKSCLGILVGLVALTCSSMGAADWREGRDSTEWTRIDVYCEVLAVAVAFKILFSCHRASKANRSASICFSCSSRCLSSLLSSCNNFSSTVLEYSLIMLLKSLFKPIFCFPIPTKDAVLRL